MTSRELKVRTRLLARSFWRYCCSSKSMEYGHEQCPVFQSQLLAHMQEAGSCDLILNKRALGNGRAWQQGCRENGFSNTPKSYHVL